MLMPRRCNATFKCHIVDYATRQRTPLLPSHFHLFCVTPPRCWSMMVKMDGYVDAARCARDAYFRQLRLDTRVDAYCRHVATPLKPLAERLCCHSLRYATQLLYYAAGCSPRCRRDARKSATRYMPHTRCLICAFTATLASIPAPLPLLPRARQWYTAL